MMDELLVKAGRAGLDAYYDNFDSISNFAANARAVLEVLGVTWGGEWEWGVRWADTGEEHGAAHENEADRWVVLSSGMGRKMRRPKLTVAWEEVSDGDD